MFLLKFNLVNGELCLRASIIPYLVLINDRTFNLSAKFYFKKNICFFHIIRMEFFIDGFHFFIGALRFVVCRKKFFIKRLLILVGDIRLFKSVIMLTFNLFQFFLRICSKLTNKSDFYFEISILISSPK